MFRHARMLGLAVSVLAGAAGAAHAQAVPFKETADGSLTSLTPITEENPVGHMDWTAAGLASHLGKYTEVGGHDFYADGTLSGWFESTSADGATISGTYEGVYYPLPDKPGVFAFEVEIVWTAGTGRLAGVTGAGSAYAELDGASGRLHLDAVGTLDLR